MTRPTIATLLALFCLFSLGWANNGGLEKDLKSDYVGKTLTLRHFYGGDHLKFSADGTLQGDAPIGPWTVDGQIAVEKVELKGNMLELRGRRINVVFDSSKPVDQLLTLERLSGKERKDREKSLRERQVRVEIDFPSSTPTQDEIGLAVHAVFLMYGESMIDLVPPFWRSYIAGLEGKPIKIPPSPEGTVYRVSRAGSQKDGVSAPRALHAPDPEYSELARKTKYAGTCVFWLIVNTKGEPENIQTVRPLGLGLDERALDAISTWRFEPAKRDGEPVPAQINIEVSFRLY